MFANFLHAVLNGLPGIEEVIETIDFAGKTVVYVGDSITDGVGATSNSNRWATRHAAAKGAIEDNRGLSGRVLQNGVTGGDCLALHPVYDNAIIPTYTTDHALLIFALGVNDVGTNNGTMNVNDYGTTYRSALNFIINTGGWPVGRILLLTPYFITGYDQYLGSCGVVTQGTQTRLFAYRDEVIEVGGEFGVAVGNICDAMAGASGLLTADGVHPNNTGHQFIADFVEGLSI